MIQTVKGWTFVLVTSLVLFGVLLRRGLILQQAFGRLSRSEAQVREQLQLQATHARACEQAYRDTVLRLRRACEFRDWITGAHLGRVSAYVRVLCQELGVDPSQSDLMSMAAGMHDLGKIAIPDEILHKPGPLSEKEWEQMRRHVTIGSDLLGGSPSELLALAAQIARSHHEHWDGTGYPSALKGEQIPLCGRIVMLADVYDVLRSERPYKPAYSHPHAFRVLMEGDDRTLPSHFDPAVLAAFARVHGDFARIHDTLQD